jgi:hypothetical protein
MRGTETTPDAGIEVYDVDSGIGGHFTISIVQSLEDGNVVVRVWQGRFTKTGWTSYGLFDGKTFQTHRSQLVNHRTLS